MITIFTLARTSQNKFKVRIAITTGGTVGLAEWIIDGSHVLLLIMLVAPGPVRIGGHYFHTWCPYVRLSVRHMKQKRNVTPLNQNMQQC